MELRLRKQLNNLKYGGVFDYQKPTLAGLFDIQQTLYDPTNFSGNSLSQPFAIFNKNAGNKPTKQQLNTLLSKINESGINDSVVNNDVLFNQISSTINGAVNIGKSVISNLSVKDEDELLADAGSYNSSIMGIGYTGLNSIDKDAELSGYDSSALTNTLGSIGSGMSAGSAAFGPVGGVVGGAVGLLSGIGSWIGGKHKLRKRINNAKNFALRSNIASKAGAMTMGLQNKYYGDNAYTLDDVLYT